MVLEDIIRIAQVFGYGFAGLSLIITAISYIKNNKVKKGEWLRTLFEKFYEEEKFKKVRREIEYDNLPGFLLLNGTTEPNPENEEELVNYLNFFEFIAILVKRSYLNRGEINDIFGYYLKSINKNEFLRKYLETYDFENLQSLLKKYE